MVHPVQFLCGNCVLSPRSVGRLISHHFFVCPFCHPKYCENYPPPLSFTESAINAPSFPPPTPMILYLIECHLSLPSCGTLEMPPFNPLCNCFPPFCFPPFSGVLTQHPPVDQYLTPRCVSLDVNRHASDPSHWSVTRVYAVLAPACCMVDG